MRLFDLLKKAFTKLGAIANYIVDEYDSGSWHIIKYSNGKCVVTTEQAYSTAITNAGGFGYYRYQVFALPSVVKTVTKRHVSCMCNYPIAYSVMDSSSYPTNDDQIYVGVYCAGSTTRTVTYYIEVEGKWK